MGERPFLGITVMPEYIQNEGVEPPLDRLIGVAGASAVSTSPYVMAPADEASGAREPPIDGGAGKVRRLDRPLWNRHALYVRTAPSFVPDLDLYRGLRYQPAPPDRLTEREGAVVGAFVRAAKARGLEVHLQVQAAIPPGYRVQFGGPEPDDMPHLPDGRPLGARVDKNGSLASPHILAYVAALLRDLCRAYPEIDAIRIDWPEYPPYSLDGIFTDFGPHAETAAAELGFDFAHLRAAALRLYRTFHGGLGDADLVSWLDVDGGRYALLRLLIEEPAILEWLRFKAALVGRLLGTCRAALDQASGGQIGLIPQVFPPPWSAVSGFDARAAAPLCHGIAVKLYTMHWPMILRNYGETLRAANPHLTEAMLARCLSAWADIIDGPGPAKLADLAYPEPDQPHPVGAAAQARKIARARAEAAGMPILAMAHGYGPPSDFERRATVAWQASGRRLWVNRYGYLSDAKLAVLGALARSETS